MAVTLLAIGLLAIAGLGATAARAVRGGSAQTRAAVAAQSRFDSLASVPCARIEAAIPAGQAAAAGTAAARGVTEHWTARMENNRNMVRVTNAITVAGRAASYHFVSLRACR
jgi:Tfp pilus assembly protein PilV